MTSPHQEPSTEKGLSALDTILVVKGVAGVRDKTTGPLLAIARFIVYGFALLIISTAALILIMIALVRLTNQLVPAEIWATYVLLGLIFTITGCFLGSKRFN